MTVRCAQITHGHPTGYAVGALATMICHLLDGDSLEGAVLRALHLLTRYPGHEETSNALRQAHGLAATGNPTPENVERLGRGWTAEETLAIAVYCALVGGPIRQALLLAVNHSGDSDATGATCGNLLGTRHGDLENYRGRMTTQLDCGAGPAPSMLRCEWSESNLYTSLVLALRDMRQANGRDLVTGVGDGNESWIGLSLAMIVLDTLSGSQNGVGKRFTGLLTAHGISPDDANAIYKLRCSLLHGYGPPKASAVGGRAVLLTPDTTAFAVDTSTPGQALVSVPVFCGRLTERIAAEAPQNWDTSLIDTDIKI